MKSILEFPIKHIEGNLVFGHDGTVWAYYGIEGFGYDFREDEEKMVPFLRQLTFLQNNGHDLHMLVVPAPTDAGSIFEETIERMKTIDYSLQENGIDFMRQVEEVLTSERNVKESSEYYNYLGIQLDPKKNKYKDGNAGTHLISSAKEFLKGLNSPVYRAVGLEAYDILKEEITVWKDQADTLLSTISAGYSSPVRKLNAAETIYLVDKVYAVGNGSVEFRQTFRSGREVSGEDENGTTHHAIRPDFQTFINLQDTDVEEMGPKTLRLSKIINNEIDECYVQYLVSSKMTEAGHPGFEWLYNLQSSLSFPVSISIRPHYQTNERITKRLSNARLEFQDQEKEAFKGGADVDLSVAESERGAINMENYFKQTRQPGYACSFVFRVSAEDRKTLKTRVDLLHNELSYYGITLMSPYGEQLNLMMEMIPGAKQYNEDYKIEVDPGILAGMMFGATTNIGDNRGFYIGETRKMKRPVFIQPDLAAKAFESVNNMFDSISIMVAGMTGKGKSVCMNLLTYLSVLTGSMALVIDPKGDRKNWIHGLPCIPKELISIWTLGESKEDAGCLDPFRTSQDIREAQDICMDILSYLANIDIQDDQFTVLSEALEEVGKRDDPCIGAVITYLQKLYEHPPANMSEVRHQAVERLKSTLETLKREQLAKLLFGEVDQDYKVLKVDTPIQVMMVQNLNLPDVTTKKYRISHKISEAILISMTAFTKQYMFSQDRSRHKVILQDESSSIDRSAIGSELMDFIVRKGRYYNTTLLKGSQNATDHGDDVANMGMKFSFALRKTSEALEMLDFFDLPQTANNIQMLKTLDRGEALFQDIYGRSAIIQINPVFSDLLEAFDSSTSSKEEKEREKAKSQVLA